MPSLSPKQARFMRAVAHDPKFAAKVGVPMKVGKEFAAADQAKIDPLDTAIKTVATKRRGGKGGVRF